jgi:hypothetical protein
LRPIAVERTRGGSPLLVTQSMLSASKDDQTQCSIVGAASSR